jgi:hypothetical protein
MHVLKVMYALVSVESPWQLTWMCLYFYTKLICGFWIFRWRICYITSQSGKSISCETHACYRVEILEVLSFHLICQIYQYMYARKNAGMSCVWSITYLLMRLSKFYFCKVCYHLSVYTYNTPIIFLSKKNVEIALAWNYKLTRNMTLRRWKWV